MKSVIVALLLACVCASAFWLVRCRLLRYLHYLQQEDYAPKRFWRWVWAHRAFDRKATALVLIVYLFEQVSLHLIDYPYLTFALVSTALILGFYLIAVVEKDPRKQAKLPLKMTERATRIYRTSLGISLIATGFMFLSLPFWLFQVLLIQLVPLYLIGAVMLLSLGEKRRQARFAAEAKAILSHVAPYTIGITGSYGKTSTKMALGHILQITLGPTFWPLQSVNTPMGNTREIRAHLKKGHQYAVFEMGAYQRGSIARLCALTPPQAAIITAVGTAHLERFKSRENIYLAKAELAQALPKDGILVCNGDDEGASRIAREFPTKTTLRYGFDPSREHLDCHISEWHTTEKGTSFTFEWHGNRYAGSTALFGKPNLSNLAAVFTLACALGAHPEYVIAAIRTLAPVDNRLQVIRENGITYLRDAYNSNPNGFLAALDVLRAIPSERRILVTPGMIELGPLQYQENERLGKAAAQICDMAIIVDRTNREALLAGLQAGGLTPDKIQTIPTRDQALKTLNSLKRAGDTVLIENDLTDLYESTPRF